ncbi:MAG: 50S ribosomal protein L19 [Candidatus Portnoybacteria bacterium RBG_19FT_COMBO_36_7]|uniref:Large ribosomal subunit protein bL19 n=1 Tax=Candidatus Portnoybacteria bacterium RBG_19FT_COMBO_36_7 TaxID=1801992 RepID=A0A1G2F8M4_9BACT|nr:MAG: 50S ribosomal protein L19 [Candidatus Portnoybacteria bacterium RBG_19FT_COMBO_36_7]
MKMTEEQLKKDLPEIKPGYTVIVHQKIKEGDKERIQHFQGLVIAQKHGSGINATFTVRKISAGVAVERIFPLHSPNIQKIEVVKKSKVRRAKLYYLRGRFGKQAKMKKTEAVVPETVLPEQTPDQTAE